MAIFVEDSLVLSIFCVLCSFVLFFLWDFSAFHMELILEISVPYPLKIEKGWFSLLLCTFFSLQNGNSTCTARSPHPYSKQILLQLFWLKDRFYVLEEEMKIAKVPSFLCLYAFNLTLANILNLYVDGFSELFTRTTLILCWVSYFLF